MTEYWTTDDPAVVRWRDVAHELSLRPYERRRARSFSPQKLFQRGGESNKKGASAATHESHDIQGYTSDTDAPFGSRSTLQQPSKGASMPSRKPKRPAVHRWPSTFYSGSKTHKDENDDPRREVVRPKGNQVARTASRQPQAPASIRLDPEAAAAVAAVEEAVAGEEHHMHDEAQPYQPKQLQPAAVARADHADEVGVLREWKNVGTETVKEYTPATANSQPASTSKLINEQTVAKPPVDEKQAEAPDIARMQTSFEGEPPSKRTHVDEAAGRELELQHDQSQPGENKLSEFLRHLPWEPTPELFEKKDHDSVDSWPVSPDAERRIKKAEPEKGTAKDAGPSGNVRRHTIADTMAHERGKRSRESSAQSSLSRPQQTRPATFEPEEIEQLHGKGKEPEGRFLEGRRTPADSISRRSDRGGRDRDHDSPSLSSQRSKALAAALMEEETARKKRERIERELEREREQGRSRKPQRSSDKPRAVISPRRFKEGEKQRDKTFDSERSRKVKQQRAKTPPMYEYQVDGEPPEDEVVIDDDGGRRRSRTRNDSAPATILEEESTEMLADKRLAEEIAVAELDQKSITVDQSPARLTEFPDAGESEPSMKSEPRASEKKRHPRKYRMSPEARRIREHYSQSPPHRPRGRRSQESPSPERRHQQKHSPSYTYDGDRRRVPIAKVSPERYRRQWVSPEREYTPHRRRSPEKSSSGSRSPVARKGDYRKDYKHPSPHRRTQSPRESVTKKEKPGKSLVVETRTVDVKPGSAQNIRDYSPRHAKELNAQDIKRLREDDRHVGRHRDSSPRDHEKPRDQDKEGVYQTNKQRGEESKDRSPSRRDDDYDDQIRLAPATVAYHANKKPPTRPASDRGTRPSAGARGRTSASAPTTLRGSPAPREAGNERHSTQQSQQYYKDVDVERVKEVEPLSYRDAGYTTSEASLLSALRREEELQQRKQRRLDHELRKKRDNRTYAVGWIAAQLVGGILCLLIGFWTGLPGRGNGDPPGFIVTPPLGAPNATGYGWTSNPDKMFNLHPLLMTLSIIYLNAQAMLLYRTCACTTPNNLKYIHAIIQVCVFAGFCIGLHCIATYKSFNKLQTISSTHSLFGLFTVILFAIQLLVGSGMFNLFFSVPREIQTRYKPLHRYFGLLIFLAACLTATMGMAQAQTRGYSVAGLFCKFFVICLLVFALCIVFLVGVDKNKAAKQRPHEQEKPLRFNNPNYGTDRAY